MITKRFVVIGLSAIVILVGILAACAGPTSTPTSTPTTTPTASPTPTGPLAQIIAGAKKEGTVSVTLRSGFTPTSIDRLRNEIKQVFGVDLDIKFTPSLSMPKNLTMLVMELQAGTAPTYDLITFMTSHVAPANAADTLEQVDWKPLITADTNPEMVPQQKELGGSIIAFTGHVGIMVNSDKVRADEFPQTLRDLANNPKWSGKVAFMNYPGSWARWAYIMGKEKTWADLRALLKNKAMGGIYADVQNRYLIGETWFALLDSVYLKSTWDKGMPAVWQSLDYSERENFEVVVTKGAAHPNAAKLVAIYLASPAGAKFTLEGSGAGNLYYPGNFEHDILAQNERLGIPEYSIETYPGLLEYSFSDRYSADQKEVQPILLGQ